MCSGCDTPTFWERAAQRPKNDSENFERSFNRRDGQIKYVGRQMAKYNNRKSKFSEKAHYLMSSVVRVKRGLVVSPKTFLLLTLRFQNGEINFNAGFLGRFKFVQHK